MYIFFWVIFRLFIIAWPNWLFVQGGLSWAGSDNQGVHAGGDGHRPQVAGGVCSQVLQVLWPHQAQQAEEAAKDWAVV